jgi:dTDP-4-dehydrorhamnose reductase
VYTLSLTGLDAHVFRADEASRTTRPVVVLGAAGQLGEIIATASQKRWQTVALTRAEVDLTCGRELRRMLADVQPWAIVNCAGYNNVDGAEDDAATALAVNAFAVRTMAAAARDSGAVLVHYSSDFIFDGNTQRPYSEESRPSPQSVYAASKLMGEWFAADVAAHYVIRVESLFGGLSRRKSSLDHILERLAIGSPVRVFVDRVVSPSYVWDVAEATLALLSLQPSFGIYHCVNSGHATWHEIAVEAARVMDVETVLEPTTLGALKLRAPRPVFSALANDKLRAAGIGMPTWQDALAREIRARQSSPSTH